MATAGIDGQSERSQSPHSEATLTTSCTLPQEIAVPEESVETVSYRLIADTLATTSEAVSMVR